MTSSKLLDSWELVRSAQAGDTDSFGMLYERYAVDVRKYVLVMVRDHAAAEDVTQETFVRALSGIQRVTPCGKDFGAWLTRIARNIVFDRAKSARFRTEVQVDELADIAPMVASAEDETIARSVRAEIASMIGLLAPEHRLCVLLRFFDGLSVAETAKILRRTAGATRALQYRAVRRLGELVEERSGVLASNW